MADSTIANLPSGSPAQTTDQLPIQRSSTTFKILVSDILALATGAVSSVFGRTGSVTAQSGDYSVSEVTGAAPLASPALSGTPTAPTATSGTNTTQLATTAFVIATALSNPMTTLGDIIYENATPVPTRLAGNTTVTKEFLTQTGTGSASAAPAWGTIAGSDLPKPSATTLGGIESFAAVANEFLTSLSTSGVLAAAQPTLNNLGSSTASVTIANTTHPITLTWTAADSFTLQQATAATSSVNKNSPQLAIEGSYWNGSSAALDVWQISDQFGAGANPTSTLTFTQSGSTGAASVLVPMLSVGASPGFTVNNSGMVTTVAENATTGFNGIDSPGIPSVLAAVTATAQSAAISGATILASPPVTIGLYRISFVATVTTAATAAGVLGGSTGFTVTYKNGNGDSLSKTTALATPIGIGAANTTSDSVSGSLYALAANTSAITYSFGYTAGTGTPMQYDIAVCLELVG
jgi:hypothetical protein